jgi:hypothetical protein
VDGLQCPTALEFGPGGIFGTDLYISLYIQYSDSVAHEPNTEEIIVIDTLGTVTEFATGPQGPEFITLDPSEVLYLSVAGGILRIAKSSCGDARGDEAVNIGDAVHLINYIFKGGPAPDPLCVGDADGDDAVNIGDAVYIINYIFKGGPAPVEGCCS